MPDPLRVLPNNLRSMCIEFAIAGTLAGPLDFIMVSRHWEHFLLNSPSLWTQIYIQNGEDELARISTFLHLSKQRKLHVDVMTVLRTVDSLRLVAEHISRVRTISIRPGASDTFTVFHSMLWRRTATYILDILSNGMQLSDVDAPACYGVTLRDNELFYYHAILIQFTVAASVASVNEQNSTWDRITEYVLISYRCDPCPTQI
jgi:hypothetical protein